LGLGSRREERDGTSGTNFFPGLACDSRIGCTEHSTPLTPTSSRLPSHSALHILYFPNGINKIPCGSIYVGTNILNTQRWKALYIYM
jgi:hypothetical protein